MIQLQLKSGNSSGQRWGSCNTQRCTCTHNTSSGNRSSSRYKDTFLGPPCQTGEAHNNWMHRIQKSNQWQPRMLKALRFPGLDPPTWWPLSNPASGNSCRYTACPAFLFRLVPVQVRPSPGFHHNLRTASLPRYAPRSLCQKVQIRLCPISSCRPD